MRYLAISGEDSSTYLLVCDKSCFVHSKSVHVLLAQARPAMINHHTSIFIVSDMTATDIPRRIDPELSPQGRSFRPSATSPGGRPYP